MKKTIGTIIRAACWVVLACIAVAIVPLALLAVAAVFVEEAAGEML